MKYRNQLLIFFLAVIFYAVAPRVYSSQKNTDDVENAPLMRSTIEVKTKTAFKQRQETDIEDIPFEKKFEDDKNLEYGTEKVIEEGAKGKKAYTFLVTFWQNEIIDRQLIKTDTTPSKPEKIAVGKKVVWRETAMPDVGKIKYWRKLKVWATKYDANCIGCTGRTFSGTAVKKGVCAVDPKVITMGDYFYVEGYGLCKAEDIGGAIKGAKIDLGFENAKMGNWITRFTNIYLLTPPKLN